MPPLRLEQGILPLPESPAPIPIVWVMITSIVNNKLSVLAARRTGSNNLTFPGGKIEPGEKKETAIIRETQEETGLAIEAETFLVPLPTYTCDELATRTFCTQGKQYVANPWVLMIDEINDQKITNKQPEKNGDWMWFTVVELMNEMMRGNVPSFILEDWLNFSIDRYYEKSSSRPFRASEIPAYYLAECAEMIEQFRFEKFRKKFIEEKT